MQSSIDVFFPPKKKKPGEYPTLFNFSHPYHKLNCPKYTTIRSTEYAVKKKLHIGMIGWVKLLGVKDHLVKIIGWDNRKIADIPLNTLKRDIAHPGYKINTYEEFVEGLNLLLQKSGIEYASNQIDTVKKIFFLEKIIS